MNCVLEHSHRSTGKSPGQQSGRCQMERANCNLQPKRHSSRGICYQKWPGKAVLTYTTREGITPVFLISTLFSRVWKDLPGAPEKEKHSICSHVKYLWENLKLLKTLSIHTYLHNCKKGGNIWKTSEISENIIFPSLKWFHLNKDWTF